MKPSEAILNQAAAEYLDSRGVHTMNFQLALLGQDENVINRKVERAAAHTEEPNLCNNPQTKPTSAARGSTSKCGLRSKPSWPRCLSAQAPRSLPNDQPASNHDGRFASSADRRMDLDSSNERRLWKFRRPAPGMSRAPNASSSARFQGQPASLRINRKHFTTELNLNSVLAVKAF